MQIDGEIRGFRREYNRFNDDDDIVDDDEEDE